MPGIKQWINKHNPVIYWYILRMDNPSDSDISQWAVELYTHQSLSITEYSDDIHVFTNSFHMIHELSNYCHSRSLQKDDLFLRLQVLNTSFETIPQIGGERISPIIQIMRMWKESLLSTCITSTQV
jgi:hypothetical protein